MDTKPFEVDTTEEMEESTEVPAYDVPGRMAAGTVSTNLDQDEQMAVSGKAAGAICAESGVVSPAGIVLSK